MNGSRFALLVAIALAAVPTLAEFTTIARAHEVALSDFTAPTSVNSTMSFKPCQDCPQMTRRVTAETEYLINNRKVALADFRDAIARVNNRQDETVIVMHHLEMDVVTSIAIRL